MRRRSSYPHLRRLSRSSSIGLSLTSEATTRLFSTGLPRPIGLAARPPAPCRPHRSVRRCVGQPLGRAIASANCTRRTGEARDPAERDKRRLVRRGSAAGSDRGRSPRSAEPAGGDHFRGVSMRALMIFALPTLLAACALPDDLGPISGPSVPLVNGAGASIGAVQVEPRRGRQLSPDRGGGSAARRSRTSPACGRAMRRPCIRKRRRALEPGGATARASEPARRARRRLAQPYRQCQRARGDQLPRDRRFACGRGWHQPDDPCRPRRLSYRPKREQRRSHRLRRSRRAARLRPAKAAGRAGGGERGSCAASTAWTVKLAIGRMASSPSVGLSPPIGRFDRSGQRLDLVLILGP